MNDLIEVIIYPIQRIVALLFSLEVVGGLSVGALIVSALLLQIIFKALVGSHIGGIHSARGSGTRDSSGGSESD